MGMLFSFCIKVEISKTKCKSSASSLRSFCFLENKPFSHFSLCLSFTLLEGSIHCELQLNRCCFIENRHHLAKVCVSWPFTEQICSIHQRSSSWQIEKYYLQIFSWPFCTQMSNGEYSRDLCRKTYSHFSGKHKVCRGLHTNEYHSSGFGKVWPWGDWLSVGFHKSCLTV